MIEVKPLNNPKIEQINERFREVEERVYGLSLRERERRGLDSKDYTFGQVDAGTFAAVLSSLKLEEGDLFYDLGSGIGKAILTAAAFYPEIKCIGIEYLIDLHNEACGLKEELSKQLIINKDNVSFQRGDFLRCDLSQAKLVYASSTCFETETLNLVARKLESAPSGCYFIALSQKFYVSHLELTASFRTQMSWNVGGDATRMYVYKRL